MWSSSTETAHSSLKRAIWIGLAAALVFSAPRGTATPGHSLAHVQQVLDGDTLRVQLAAGRTASVRLIGVDAPEIAHRRRQGEYLGEEAKAFARSLVDGAQVQLKSEPGRADHDDYGRLLRYVFLEDGRLLNAELIRRGLAYSFNRFPHARRDEFRALEESARRKGLGLWAEAGLAELSWNVEQGREPLRLHAMSNRSWALQHGSFIKPHVRSEQLSQELGQLRRWLEQSEGLERKMTDAGYVKR